ncbi:hypothetical protein F4778DRAFT_374543 [Xylariomycetidae sp. FL2044]|nr:hypothetical protein F4778DRAFT_374543 [Xylariomycetidae sp. FL2044]
MPSVLLFGATGFIGAPLAKQIKQAHPSWPVTIFIRNQTVEEYFKSEVGVDRIEYGTFGDSDKISTLSREHDLVINAADSKNTELTASILAGQAQKPGGAKGKLVHVSGGGNFLDGTTKGEFNPEGKIWNDDNEEDIKLIHDQMFNGAADKMILDAGAEGKVDAYIACPVVVYGRSSGPAPVPGLGYSLYTSNAKALGFVPYVGPGTSVAATVHIDDVLTFLLSLIERVVKDEIQGSAYSKYYILSGPTVTNKDLATGFARAMHQVGIMPSPEPKSVAFEEAGGLAGLLASNMLVRNDRAVRMGFRATRTSMLAQLDEDLAGLV